VYEQHESLRPCLLLRAGTKLLGPALGRAHTNCAEWKPVSISIPNCESLYIFFVAPNCSYLHTRSSSEYHPHCSLLVQAQVTFFNNATVTIEGSLVLTSTSTLVVASGASGGNSIPLEVLSCATLDGTLLIPTHSGAVNVTILNASCINGHFASVIVSGNANGCITASALTTSNPSGSVLIVAFQEVSGCGEQASSFIPGLSMPIALFIVIGIPILVLAAVAIGVLLGVPALRKRVVPFRDRQRHQFSTGRNSTPARESTSMI